MRKLAVAVVAIVLTASPVFAQAPSFSPTPIVTPVKSSHSWTYFMAIATIGIAGLTLVLSVLGYLVQAPGFRRGEKPARTTSPPPASS